MSLKNVVLPSNEIYCFIDQHKILISKNLIILFVISNEYRFDWWSILHLHSKNVIYLFHSFGVVRLRNFIVQNNEKIAKKNASGNEKVTQTDHKLPVLQTSFSWSTYERLKKQEKEKLNATRRDFCHSISKFDKFHNVRDTA